MSATNGHSAGGEDTPLSPIIGSKRCRVTRRMLSTHAMAGPWARAWRVDLHAARKHLPLGAPPDATVVHWIVEAPWSSQVVHSYSLIVAHLRLDLATVPVTRYLDGATHELALIAIHPEADRDAMLDAPTNMDNWLRPPVFAAQMKETSDDAADRRVEKAVELVCEGRLSPHPTHFRAWAVLFGDNMVRK